jgi:quercetin dioxygenase-like cupin family protein
MNENDFEKQLRKDGFTEVEFQKLAPRPGRGRHRHHFAIRGLVISGAFVVRQDGDPVVYGPGQIFSVAEGELHDEWIEAEGAHVLVGRRFSDPAEGKGSSSTHAVKR